MTVTWGDDSKHTPAYKWMRENANFEHECMEQARRELRLPLNCTAREAMQVAARAQQIKLERTTKGKG